MQSRYQWAPPTAFQPGLIGPHWSKGWIIENCKIHDSKCSGISLGKKHDLKDNCWSINPEKGGAQTYTEIIFSNLRDGWSREKIGGHIVRNNEIYHCGQAGIVGCMGGAFSDVVGNHIHTSISGMSFPARRWRELSCLPQLIPLLKKTSYMTATAAVARLGSAGSRRAKECVFPQRRGRGSFYRGLSRSLYGGKQSPALFAELS